VHEVSIKRFSNSPEGESTMRLIKMLGLAAMAAVAAMAFVGATSASALNTQLCTEHASLTCGAGKAATSVHMVLAAGTVGELLADISVLCLGYLVEATALGLGTPQSVHSSTQSFTGCGTGSAHSNCAVTIPSNQQPLYSLLKTGLDEGTLTAVSGQTRLVCSNLGLDCIFDVDGMSFQAGGGHVTSTLGPTTELGGVIKCPGSGLVDALLEKLTNTYILG
jgi:hypothetical protein